MSLSLVKDQIDINCLEDQINVAFILRELEYVFTPILMMSLYNFHFL